MSVVGNLASVYKNGNAIVRLIYLNVAVYLVVQLFIVVLLLLKIQDSFILNWLTMPASYLQVLYRPWTVLTYMFFHVQFFHILFNMFALYWFGKIFLYEFSEKQLVGLYLLGGISGGLLYMLFYNVFPLFAEVKFSSQLMGASGSIMAVIVASAMKFPNMELRMLLLGNIKLKYIAIISVLVSVFGIAGTNAGGEIAHVGGALFGYFFVVSLHRGKDLTKWMNSLIDLLHTLFVKRKPRSFKTRNFSEGRKMTDAEFNMNKAQTMRDIDRILDKIKKSGYDSLNDEEKRKLFEQKR